MIIHGSAATRQIYINGKEIPPNESQKLRNHSPDGFSWGYGGSGPSQAALAICLWLFGKTDALKVYQKFKWEFIAKQKFDEDFTIDVDMWKWKEENL